MLLVKEPHFEYDWYIEFRGFGFDYWDKYSYSLEQVTKLSDVVSLFIEEDYKQYLPLEIAAMIKGINTCEIFFKPKDYKILVYTPHFILFIYF